MSPENNWTIAKGLFWSFVFVALLVVASGVSRNEISVDVFYTLRLIEAPLFALASLRLVGLAGARGIRASLVSVGAGLTLNLAWIAYQFVFGAAQPLLDPGSKIPQYGVSLLGEAGAFPSGQLLVILLAGAVALSVTIGQRKPADFLASASLVVLLFLSLAQVGSRISTVSGILMIGVWVTSAAGFVTRTWGLFGKSLGVAGIASLGFLPLFLPRIRVDLIQQLFSGELTRFRFEEIYFPILEVLSGAFFLGLGPGRLRESFGAEAHSLFLALIGDVGLVGLLIFLVAYCVFTLWGVRRLKETADPIFRLLIFWSILANANLLVSGVFQSSHMSSISVHLHFFVLGLCLASRSSSTSARSLTHLPKE